MPDRVVVFDTSCLLCSKFIRILLENDQGQLSYTGFESKFSAGYLPDNLRLKPETVVFYQSGFILLKSRAIFAILSYVRWRYRWMRVFRFLPNTFLDWIYDWVATNRYAWFGQSITCFMPKDNVKAKFLD